MFARMKKLTWGMTTWKSGELAALLIGRTRAWAVLSGTYMCPDSTPVLRI